MADNSQTSRPRVASVPAASDSPLRVALVDDDELTTRGLAAMVRASPDQIELVRLTRPLTKPVDIALFDHASNRPGDRPNLAQLVADPRIRRVALYTWNFQPWAAPDLLSRGASAYLSKGLTTAALIEALHSVSTQPGLVAPNARAARAMRKTGEHGDVLTGREAEILSLICSGLSNAEVSATLSLSVNSVKSYIRSCYRKIDVDSRSKAVLWGLSNGFGGSGLPVRPVATAASANPLAAQTRGLTVVRPGARRDEQSSPAPLVRRGERRALFGS